MLPRVTDRCLRVGSAASVPEGLYHECISEDVLCRAGGGALHTGKYRPGSLDIYVPVTFGAEEDSAVGHTVQGMLKDTAG